MKKKLIVLFPGPVWKIPSTLHVRMINLSEKYYGTVFSATKNSFSTEIGSFKFVSSHYYGNNYKLFSNITYIISGIFFAITQKIKNHKYDLVVTYDPLRAGLLGVIMSIIFGAKLCVEVNGNFNSPANYLDGGGWADRIKKILYPRISNFVLGCASGIKVLYPSQLGRYAKKDNQVISCFFDFTDLRAFHDLGEEKVILFVGFPFWLKGVDLLIAAFKKVWPSHQDWQLKILGWFPDQHLLERHIAQHPAIIVHPPVHFSDMPGQIGRCGIFVLPSRTEAMGRVLLEAAACAKPRIGADIEGIPRVINDSVDGVLFEPGNELDLARKLGMLMGDPSMRQRMGNAAKMRVESEFDEVSYIKHLIEFYQKVLG